MAYSCNMYYFIVLLFGLAYVSGDLYNSSDPMVILNNKNFYETIISSENGWIIEFYNSWCGHCIHFAPDWRQFASEITDWSHTFKVGVLDCSDEENGSICRDYEVMGYPSIRLFGAFTKKDDFGVNIHTRNIKEMQGEIVDFITQRQAWNNGSSAASWVNLLMYNGLIKDIFNNASSHVTFAVLIIEKNDSKIGRHSILDLGNYPMIYVRTINPDSKEVIDLNVKNFPSVLIVNRSGERELLKEPLSTPEELTALVIKHLGLMKQKAGGNSGKFSKIGLSVLQEELNKEDKENVVDEVKEDVEDRNDKTDKKEEESGGKAEEINSERLNYDDDLPDNAFNKHHHQVFMVDMENAISYALRHEVILHKSISSETFTALKNFIKVMVKYLPLRPQVHDYLKNLHDLLLKRGDSIQGIDFEKALQFLESSSAKLPDKQPWKECQGSQSNFRGYPCGLWVLFHTITVSAYVRRVENTIYDPLEPLKAIHGYVKYFFSCEHCSKHFQEMYSLDAESSVRAPGDEVLWLWKGHNKVNIRLKGELSEDPTHPKEQFPPKSACPKCWTKEDGLFNPDEVLQYLQKIYAKDSISLEGAQDFTKEEERKGNKLSNIFNSRKDVFLEKNYSNANDPSDLVSMKKINTNSWGFTNTDLNLCVLLYLFSTLIIAAGYFMFILKRRLRRKKYFDLYKLP